MPKGSRGIALIPILLIASLVLLGGGLLLYKSGVIPIDLSSPITSLTQKNTIGQKVAIPQEIMDSEFGFPSGHPDDADIYADFGGRWVRPHPGPFQWGLMQQSATSEIDFSTTDEFITGYQKHQMGTQVTLWPYADWDQLKRSNYTTCLIDDIFTEPNFTGKEIDYQKEGKESLKEKVFGEKDMKIGKEGAGGEPIFLPRSRCNPHDWVGYLAWVSAVIERYDGDGERDMPGLTIPVKYWEVINEPDLNADHLDFYQGTGADYAELLIKTSEVVKDADPEAKVLIAGAAGGSDQFLNFYRQVFKNKATHTAFDIGNVHCISNDDYASYNVKPYLALFKEFGLNQPIWVTEAEALVSDNVDINASQAYASTKEALKLGATRIFFAHQKFTRGDKPYPPEPNLTLSSYTVKLDGDRPQAAFQQITGL